MAVIIAHPDDEALLAGATIHKLRSAGTDVAVISFSRINREEEFRQACKKLGVAATAMFDVPASVFPSKQMLIRTTLEKLRTKREFDLVITHPMRDLHQDHKALSQEVCSVFRNTSVIFGEFGHSEYEFNPTAFVEVNHQDLEAKLAALEYYKTKQVKRYFSRSSILGLASFRGAAIARPFAEAFEIFRIVIK